MAMNHWPIPKANVICSNYPEQTATGKRNIKSVDAGICQKTTKPTYNGIVAKKKLQRSVQFGTYTCQQALWMKQALVDYGIRLNDIPIMCDNKGAIDLSKNPVKHIEIRHHFLRDNVQKGNISIEKVSSEDNIADILTKPLKCEPFNYLRLGLGMMEQID
ncbi:hypothetical protein Tco_1131800 [Tanacetum coccineum]|uniref:Copia protein n=1 Tax=Tanacetum coccineum TaxID=301880 RepID=A0ABQ5JE89_9ASTR